MVQASNAYGAATAQISYLLYVGKQDGMRPKATSSLSLSLSLCLRGDRRVRYAEMRIQGRPYVLTLAGQKSLLHSARSYRLSSKRRAAPAGEKCGGKEEDEEK